MRKAVLIFLSVILCIMMGVTMYQHRDELKSPREYYQEAQALLDSAAERAAASGSALSAEDADAVEELNAKALAGDATLADALYQKIRLGLLAGRPSTAVAGAEGLLAFQPDNYSFQTILCLVNEHTGGEPSTACYAKAVALCESAPDNPLKRYDYVLLLRLADDPRLPDALNAYLDNVPGQVEQDFIRELLDQPRAELVQFILGPLSR